MKTTRSRIIIKKKKQKKPKEFSKKVFIGVSIINIFVLAFACFMVWITRDLSPLSYLIPATAAEMAAATGFYYNKAKAENKIKLDIVRRQKGLYPMADEEHNYK